MEMILRKSNWLPAIAFAFIFISLWTVMAQSAPPARNMQQQASYSLVLPNILAPVIRKEVRDDAQKEFAITNDVSCKLPSLLRVITAMPRAGNLTK